MEHKAIDAVLMRHRLPSTIIRRIHAATLSDIGIALREQDYEVVFFSCHGGQNGLCLEGATAYAETSWRLLSGTLKEGAPNLSVVVLNACHSTSAQNALHTAAPFFIAMTGSAHDAAAIAFSEHFFDEFYRSNAIEHAFRHALSVLDQMGLGDKINPVLSRRRPSGESVVQAVFSRRQDAILIDLAQAEASISRLPIERHAFLSLLTRKIRIHGWIFKVARERAVIPIGQFFGVFSWQNAKDVVICHEVLRLRSETDMAESAGWIRLMIIYNDLRSERYRIVDRPSAIENRELLAAALSSVETCLSFTLEADDVKLPAQKLAQAQYAVTLATVRAQCDVARLNLGHQDLSRVVIALEAAISSIHDLVDELTAAVTIRRVIEST